MISEAAAILSTTEDDQRHCRIHRPLFAQLFVSRDVSYSCRGSGGRDGIVGYETSFNSSGNWLITAYARRVAQEGRQLTPSELHDKMRRRRRKLSVLLASDHRRE